MALTKPFINTIPAFDATIGTDTYINVLGGEAINGYQFSIYKNDGSRTPFYTSNLIPVSNDVSSVNIRTFPIHINGTLEGLENNNTYRISATTFGLDNLPITGNEALFTCYKNPSEEFQFQTLTGYYKLSDGSILPSVSPTLKFTFNNNDLNSIARPNILHVNLYGISGGARNLIVQDKEVYTFAQTLSTEGQNTGKIYTAIFDLDGFSINVTIDSEGNINPKSDALYSSFEIEYYITTIENMRIEGTIKNLNCFYDTLQNSPYLVVNNICDKGIIEINCSGLESFNAISNPEEPTYIDGKEVDLTATDSWAMWTRLFSLSQPYTLDVWGRKFNPNTEIIRMTSTIFSDRYVSIKYNVNTYDGVEYAFISLESGRNYPILDEQYKGYPNYVGKYYIESNYIESSSITENTNLFIGIQQQGDLFDLAFKIIEEE